MTNQDKINYLKEYKNLDNQITRLLEEKEIWLSKATKVTQTISDMPRGSNGEDSRMNAVHKMIEAEDEATKKIDKYVDLGREIRKCIETVKESDLRLLLEYRYLDGLTFEEVAVKMNYSWRWVYKLHKKALSKMDILVHI